MEEPVIAETVTANASPAAVNPTNLSPNPAVPDIAPQPPSAAVGTTLTELQRLGIHTPDSLDSLCVEESRRPFVVDGFLSVGSIGIVVGDSGLGKSPLNYQLGLCVAAGLP